MMVQKLRDFLSPGGRGIGRSLGAASRRAPRRALPTCKCVRAPARLPAFPALRMHSPTLRACQCCPPAWQHDASCNVNVSSSHCRKQNIFGVPLFWVARELTLTLL